MTAQSELWTENYAAKALPGDDIRKLREAAREGEIDFSQLEMSDR